LALLCGGVLYAALAAPPRLPIDSAYYDGEAVRLQLAPGRGGGRMMRVGPWHFGPSIDSRPRDRRLNLYLVFPGTQHRAPGWSPYDHNCILSGLPEGEEAREWDVYWAIVLDPDLREDFRSERELLLAAQANFLPPDLLEFDDLPAEGFLRAQMKVDSLPELARFRHKDGTLPRILILPARFAVRASAEPATAQ